MFCTICLLKETQAQSDWIRSISYYKTRICFGITHLTVVLTVCSGSLSHQTVNFYPSLKYKIFFYDCSVFSLIHLPINFDFSIKKFTKQSSHYAAAPTKFCRGRCFQHQFSEMRNVLLFGQNIPVCPYLITTQCLLGPLHTVANGKPQNGCLKVYFHQYVYHSCIKAMFVLCKTNTYPVNRFVKPRCGAVQLLQSQNEILGRFPL